MRKTKKIRIKTNNGVIFKRVKTTLAKFANHDESIECQANYSNAIADVMEESDRLYLKANGKWKELVRNNQIV